MIQFMPFKVKIERKGKKPVFKFVAGSRVFDSKKNAKKYEQSVEYGNDVYDDHQPGGPSK